MKGRDREEREDGGGKRVDHKGRKEEERVYHKDRTEEERVY